MAKSGKVWLVGAGPGAMGLITQRGKEVLLQAQVVLYDRLVNPGILLGTRPKTLFVDAGKTPRGKRMEQDEIHRLLIRFAKKGLNVVRLKGGDPYVFGRGGEEAEALVRARVPFEVIPGVTAGIAAPAYAGIPVTHRGISTEAVFRIGHQAQGSVSGKTLVGYMSVEGLDQFLAHATELGFTKSTPASLIERGTTTKQRVVIGTVGTLAKKANKLMVKAPAVIVVGEVVSLRNRCTPKTKKPLLGKRVILTVSENLGKEWRNLFEDQGAEVWEIPMTRIEPLPVQKKWRARVLKSDWLVFTSAAAVRAFPAVAGDLRDISRCKIAAVGKSTAQVLRSIGLVPDWVGAGPGSKELLSGWPKKAQGRILHLTGNAGNGDLVKGFRKMGFSAERLVIYKNSAGEEVPDPVLRILRTEGADWVVFASGTAAERLRKIIPRWSTEPKVIAIGPATARSAKHVGWKVCAVAKEPSSDSVLRGILKS